MGAQQASPHAVTRRRWFRAPGRVNLMGDHTDYNDGFVLPFAIDLACLAGAGPAPAPGRVRARSLEEETVVALAADGSADPASFTGWGRYVAGVLRVLAARGREPVGADIVVSSTVPEGSGLSSSAALEVSLALALADAGGLALDGPELARACQEAEQVATGVPCGIMDQLASVAGEDGSALLIDCRSLAVTPVPLPRALGVVVVHSGIPRTLDTSAYAERRRACEELAARLGVPALRDSTPAEVAGDPLGRHVVSENARVHEAVAALARGDLLRLGAVVQASHASLRDDFQVSTPELDALVQALEREGALGARLTGAGFGGCVVAVCRRGEERGIGTAAAAAYAEETGLTPRVFPVEAVAGAGPIGPQPMPAARQVPA